MRLFYSKIICLFFLITAPFKHVEAQEQFLRLDSLVIIQSDLSMSKMPSRSWEYEGHDTIQINAQSDQLVKVRYCALTLTSTSSNWAADAEIGVNGKSIHDLRIRTDGFNMLDAISYSIRNPTAIYPAQDFSSRSCTIDRFPDTFIRNGEPIYVDFIQEFYSGSNTVNYRIELLYFSYE